MKSKTLWLVGAAAVWCLAVSTTVAAEGTRVDRESECAAHQPGGVQQARGEPALGPGDALHRDDLRGDE